MKSNWIRKNTLISAVILSLPMVIGSPLANANDCIDNPTDPSCTIDEMTVTGFLSGPFSFPLYSYPTLDIPGYGYGGGAAPEPEPEPSKCDTIDADFTQCNRDSQDIYLSATLYCGYFSYGGGAVGAAGLGGAALIFSLSNPLGWTLLGIGAVGSGAGVWGSSSCYNGPAAVRDTNLAICDNNQAKTRLICGK